MADLAVGFSVGYATFFFVVPSTSPAKTLAEFIEYARANPGKLNYATGNTTAIVSSAMLANLAQFLVSLER